MKPYMLLTVYGAALLFLAVVIATSIIRTERFQTQAEEKQKVIEDLTWQLEEWRRIAHEYDGENAECRARLDACRDVVEGRKSP